MNPTKKTESRAILWWAGGAFALLLIAWTVLFVIASKNRVDEVPLSSPAEQQS